MLRRRRGSSLSFASKALIPLVIVAAAFLSYKVYVVSYEKYQINKRISTLNAELDTLAEKGEGLKMLVTRLQDTDIIEKEARKKLNFVKEGEKAVIITGLTAEAKEEDQTSQERKEEGVFSNPKKWFDVLFGEEKE